MQRSTYPKPKTLLIVWTLLMVLSGATMIFGKVTANLPLGAVSLAVLLIVAGLKSSLILHYYLDMKSASEGWSKLFSGLVWLILLSIFAIYLIGDNTFTLYK